MNVFVYTCSITTFNSWCYKSAGPRVVPALLLCFLIGGSPVLPTICYLSQTTGKQSLNRSNINFCWTNKIKILIKFSCITRKLTIDLIIINFLLWLISYSKIIVSSAYPLIACRHFQSFFVHHFLSLQKSEKNFVGNFQF